MAARIPSTFSSAYILVLYLLCLLGSLNPGCRGAFAPRETEESQQLQHARSIRVSSLLPPSVCSPSTKALGRKSSLQVVHMHGPCSQLQDKAKAPTQAEILLQDQARVNSIQASARLADKNDMNDQNDAANLPAKDGKVLGSANYIVTIGLGTPKKDLSLTFDTGSFLTWTQCEPCAGSCYPQKEPIFNPSASNSYSNVTCTSPLCSLVTSKCSVSTCVYGVQYGDRSFTEGFLGKERLSLTSTDVFDNFVFGCGQNNRGLFKGVAGLIGLGRNQLSLPSQTAQKYNQVFSYCLPSSPRSTGHLTFGNGGGLSRSVKFTPLSTDSRLSSFYGVDITGISVGGQKLSIPASVFSTAGAIIDSGTVITRLPPAAYSTLRSAFRQRMTQYPMGQPFSLFDTCYDLSKYDTVTVPDISLFFNGGVEVDVDESGALYAVSASQFCLPFAPNSADSDLAIFGNVQQKTLEVVYDGAGGRVGFAPGGCS